MEKEFIRARELTFKVRKCGYCVPNLFGESRSRNYEKGEYNNFINKKPTCADYISYDLVIKKNGIEILGMKPSKKTTDGKFKYDRISIKDLKKYCRDNGVKKYSSKSKLELVKMLISILKKSNKIN